MGTGHLGWSPKRTLKTNMQHIVLARQGRIELIEEVLKAAFGGGEGAKSEDGFVPMNNPAAVNAFMLGLKEAAKSKKA